jgi:hypothetical protein
MERGKSAISHFKFCFFIPKSGCILAPKIGKFGLICVRKSVFRHKKAQISPQIAEFRHKSPVLDTFSTQHDAMLYFCSVFKKIENEFLI